MENLYLLAFGTFGHPNDFRQTVFGNDEHNIAKHIKTFDININAIKIFPNGKLYAIRKENINGLNLISYSIYTHAKEQNSEREGTFIGSSFVFINEIPEENFILSKLNEFHKALIQNNLQNNVLKVKHSKDFVIPKIDDIDKFSFQTRKIGSLAEFNSTDSQLLLFTRIDNFNLQKKLKSGIDLLNIYDSIFFTDSKEIKDFSRSRNIYKIIDQSGFDQEIQNLEEKRKQKITNAISKFEKEKEKLDEERKKVDENLKKQLVQNKQKHSENQEEINKSENDLNELNIVYQNFLKKYDELINGLNVGKTLEQINNSYTEYKRNFEEEKKKLNTVSSLQSFQNLRINTHSSQNRHPNYNHHYDDSKENNVDNKVYIVLIVSVILNILLIVAALVYYFMFFEKQQEQYENINQEEPINNQEIISDSSQTKLNPFPDTILVANDYKLVAKQLERNMKIKDVVKVIFDKNKTEIKDFYQNQKEDYTKLLIEKNSTSFNTVDSLFTGDSIKVIPSKRSNK